MKVVFVVFDPNDWPSFQVYENLDQAILDLENEGYKLSASRDIKVSPRVRLVYRNKEKERVVFCRELKTPIQKNYLLDDNKNLSC